MNATEAENTPPLRKNILQLFHEIQHDNTLQQYISNENLRGAADYLGVSIAEAHGVLSFYKLFSSKPRGRYVIRLCDSLSCRISKSLHIYNHISKTLGIKQNETTQDGLFTLEIVNCLGNCHTAPNMMIHNRLYTNLTNPLVDEILGTYRDMAKEEM